MLKTANKNSSHANIKNVIRFVRERGPLSRAELSEQMAISQPTMTRIIGKLTKSNILNEEGLGVSNGGRRPVLLRFNANCFYAVGVELGRSDIKVALANMNGDVLSFMLKETDCHSTIDDIVVLVKITLRQILTDTSVDPSLILGIGVGMPGPLNETEDGRISPPNFYGDTNVPLKEKLERELDFPVTIDNDANVAALAENWFGKGLELDNFAYVMADVGVGSGLIINNDLYRGNYGEAGEIGHSTIDVFGEQCTCGNYGCLETFVSIPALMKKLELRLKVGSQAERDVFGKAPEQLKFEDVGKAHGKGSSLAKQLLDETGKFLGAGIANFVNLFAPQMVVIGGKVGNVNPLIIDRVKEAIQSRVIGSKGKRITVVASDFEEGVVLGAAALVIHRSFYSLPALSSR